MGDPNVESVASSTTVADTAGESTLYLCLYTQLSQFDFHSALGVRFLSQVPRKPQPAVPLDKQICVTGEVKKIEILQCTVGDSISTP